MNSQNQIDCQRIEKAIGFITANFKKQPSLDEIAASVNVSPFHFQKIFSEWVGVSPKKFMQYLSVSYAKGLLQNQASLLDTAYETGLSGPSRLHDLFISIEAMTPGSFKAGGAGLSINYEFADSPFGPLIIATTPKGVCHLHFEADRQKALADLKTRLPHATYQQKADQIQENALTIFDNGKAALPQIKLHIAGTPFKLKVWESLLKIPMGQISTYGAIAKSIGNPKAARAVGSAIGSNPIAYLIPCHRVIQTSGHFGGYMWGQDKKAAMIGWEAAKIG